MPLWRGHRLGIGRSLLDRLFRRAGAERPVDTPRWHEVFRWKLWRASLGLVFGTEFAVIADRWFAGHGQPAAAHASGTVGLVLFLCSPLPAVLEPLLWRLAPAPWRRVERVDEVVAALTFRQPGMLAGFDPSRGAAGRPEPVVDLPGGPGGGVKRRVALNHFAHVLLEWDGKELTLFWAYGMRRGRVIPLARTADGSPLSRRRRKQAITELVWWEHEYSFPDFNRPGAANRVVKRREASLFFVDGRGLCRLAVRAPNCPHRAVAAVAEAAGVPFTVYSFTYPYESFGEIERLMFPRRWTSKDIAW